MKTGPFSLLQHATPKRERTRFRRLSAPSLGLCLLLVLAGPARALTEVPKAVSTALHRILEVQAAGQNPAHPAEMMAPLVDFIMATGEAPRGYTADRGFDAPSAGYRFAVATRMSRVLRLAFNPKVPSALSSPASIRWSRWQPAPGNGPDISDLAGSELPASKPVVVRALEQVENTPDLTSGAYHRYLADRLLVLYSHGGSDVLVSVTRQRGPSEVGRKGWIVGSDDDWTYLYSEEQGLSRTGLGWVRSRIFGSFSVSVYIDDGQRMRCAVFQWMRAGWSGINMVRSSHLYDGLKRYAASFQAVMEHPGLPSPERIEAICTRIRGLPTDTLKTWFADYLAQIESRLGNARNASHKWIAQHLRPARLIEDLDGRRLADRLALEWMKQAMGKASRVRLGPLAAALDSSD